MGRRKIIGFDIGTKDCQISYYDGKNEEPQTLPSASDNYQIPMVLGIFKERWVYGREAKRLATVSEGRTVDDLFNRAMNGERVILGEEQYEGVWLLAKFISLALEEFDEIEYITFTTQETTIDICKMLKGIGKHIGVPRNNIFVQDYKESFCHYMFFQPKELWQYEAALFSCDGSEIKGYMLRKIHVNSGHGRDRFVTVDQVTQGNVSEFEALTPFLNEDGKKSADERFKAMIENVFDKKVISSVFLTGEGFENNWYPESLKVLCNGRRAFVGNNLYSKGACYNSIKRASRSEEGPTYLDDTKMTEQICLRMRVNGQEGWYPIVAWGSCWYEADNQWEVLLEDTSDIEILIEGIGGEDVFVEKISLEGLPDRHDYSLRMSVEVMFLDEDSCKIVFRDVGFGEFFSPTGFYFEKIIQIGGSHGQLNSMS